MSQAGELNVVENHPEIPTSFSTNSGTAIPLANELEILGTGLVSTSGSGNTITIAVTGAVAETLTGNSGGAVSPTLNNIFTVGSGSITIVGNPGTSTLTTQLTGLTNHAVLVGAGTDTITKIAATANTGAVLQNNAGADPSYSTATYPSTTTINEILYSSAANTVTGLATAIDGVLITSHIGVPSILANSATPGFVLTANAGAPPSWQTVSASGAITTITGDSGGAEVPLAGNFNIKGSGSITTVGSANTETVELTGLTDHNVLVGAGTTTITKVAPSATTGIPFVSQGAGADPSFSTAVVAGGGTGAVTFTAYAPICGGTAATNPFQSADTGFSNAGYVLTSNGAAALPSWQPTVVFDVPFTDEPTNFTAVSNNGYFITGTATALMPAAPVQGDKVEFIVDTANILTVTANAGQFLRIGAAISLVAGTAANNARGDAVTFIYRAADTTWLSLSVQGTWTVT